MKSYCITVVVFSCFLFSLNMNAQRIVCDDSCTLADASPIDVISNDPMLTKDDKTGFAVVSPVGHSSVELIQQAPRLETLDGKTIAVVGVSFMTSITHPEIKRLILKNYPSAKVILLDEMGIAGPYPAPGVIRKAKEEFQAKLKDLGVDAVISGNGGCGLCTPKETGSCIAAEYLGIPSVIIAGPGFIEQARNTALNNGVPVMRVAQYPGAFATHTADELVKNTREVLWPQIVDALTKPITEEELSAGISGNKSDVRDDVFYGTLDEVNEYFKEMKWSDGLPIIPPTYEKVQSFLKYTDMRWDETVANLPIAHRNTTTWHVAVNAVMSGCRPEYMPILIALTKGLGDPDFRRTLASTHAWTPFCWLNGPVARQLGIDSGQGQINEAPVVSSYSEESRVTAHAILTGRSINGALPSFFSDKTGKVVVDIWVDNYGTVQKAEAGAEGTTVTDSELWSKARSSAMRASFNMSADAPAMQKGTITYTLKEDKNVGADVPFQLVEEKPTFHGGDTNQFSKWVNQRLVYPDSLKKQGIQGRVTLQFTVQADGTVSNVRVLRGVHPDLDNEAVRVVASSPKWNPGKCKDKAVPVTYTFPVIFQAR